MADEAAAAVPPAPRDTAELAAMLWLREHPAVGQAGIRILHNPSQGDP